LLREFSVPLIAVVGALGWVNLSPESYHSAIYHLIFYQINLEFLVNETAVLIRSAKQLRHWWRRQADL
jgi:hypothetical protein